MIERIKGKRIPVVRSNSKVDTFRIVENLDKVNCHVIELTFSIPEIETYYKELKEKFPHVVLGMGTVTNIERAKLCIEMGVDFVVSPNYNKQVSDYLQSNGKIYIPGCLTPTEIMNAYNNGNQIIKLFPGNLVGFDYFKMINGLFAEVKFLVSGGVNEENIEQWEQHTFCTGIGGSYFKDLDTKSDEQLQSEWEFFGKK